MSDDFGTITARRAKEIDVLRKHRESLVKMLNDVDAQLRELGEITTPIYHPPATTVPTAPTPSRPKDDSLGSRPIVNTATYEEPDESGAQPGGGMRILVIVGIALVALGLIGWLIWRASSDRPKADTVIEETTTPVEPSSTAPDTVAEAEPGTVTPVAPVAAMTITPRSHDYGLIRKGTRATRQFQFRNESDVPVTISVSRSACRCLYYEYEGLVPPKASESITVTVDGAKAKAGTLRETLRVTPKAGGTGGTSFDVIATIR
jgi:hypothetical protein